MPATIAESSPRSMATFLFEIVIVILCLLVSYVISICYQNFIICVFIRKSSAKLHHPTCGCPIDLLSSLKQIPHPI